MRKKVPCECGLFKDPRSANCRGCRGNYMIGENNPAYKHGQSRKLTGNTKTYRAWSGLLSRCRNKNNKDYANYGGRGITVCDKWLEFKNFFNDMGESPKYLSIDRIDNDKGYCKENCRWATCTEQNLNQREIQKNKTSKYKGVFWHKRDNKWCTSICRNKKRYYGGCYISEDDAHQDYLSLRNSV